MAKIVYGMNLSLDGYVDHDRFAPGPGLFRHWIDNTKRLGGSLYGRKLYGLMQYWDEDQPEWGAEEKEFAVAWRAQPKWVVSRTLKAVGPNATLVRDPGAAVEMLKADREGEIDVGGPSLAQQLGEMGLIDEYRLYYHPVVLGHGTPFFGGPLPRLRLIGSDIIADDVIRVTYVPA